MAAADGVEFAREQPLLQREDVESPEDRSCCLSRLLFCWAFPVFWRGFRRGRTDLPDLPPVPERDRPLRLSREIQSLVTGSRESRCMPWLGQKIFRVTRPVFLRACVCQAMLATCSCIQPIILHSLLETLSLPEEQRKQSLALILLNALGVAGAVMGQWIFAEYAWTMFVRADLEAQVLLSHLVYRKSLFLRLEESPYTVGDLQNHFSTDCTKLVLSFFHWCHADLVISGCTLLVVAWHLTKLIGSAGLMGMLTVLSFAPFQFVIRRRLRVAAKRIQEARDVRGRLCNEFLSAMRVVKCFSLEPMALEMLGGARDRELEAQWFKRKVFPFQNFLGSSVSLFGTIISFLWLELVLDKPVDAAIAFTVLSWSALLKDSLMAVPNQIATLLDCYVSVQRIQQLLTCQEEDTSWLQQSPETLQEMSHQSDAEFILQECSIGWPLDEETCRGIQKLNLTVKPQELLLISGPIGSGKSTLLEALTGTRPLLSGTCWRRGRPMAYVAQRPWLLNGTLIENVTFGHAYHEQRIQETLESCALLQDLASLPGGRSTLVGEEGVQLSGGQKQRVALARAVYSGAEVVLLDDVLSALDAHVGKQIFEAVIAGALRRSTRLLVTHQLQYWSHPEVNRILLLRADGSCHFLGSYQELVKAQIHELTALQSEEAEHGKDEKENGDVEKEKSQVKAADAETVSRHLESQEVRRLGHILKADLMAYARACGGLGGVSTIASLMVVYYGAQLSSSLQLAFWSNANVQAEDSGHPEAREASRRYLVQYMALCLLTGCSCFCFFFGIQLVALRASKRLHDRFMQGLMYTQLRFFDLTPTGRALNRCLKDMSTMDDRMPAAFRELFESCMNVCISVLILSLFAWQALVVVPPFSVLYWMTMTVYRWPARDLRRLEGTSRSPGMSHFSDSIKGARTVRAYGHEARFLQRNLELLGQNQLTTYWFWVAQAWVSCTQEVLGTLALAAVAGVIGYRAYLGSLNPGLAGLALSYAMSMPRNLMFLSRRLATMEVEFVSIERVMEYTRLPHEVTDTQPVVDDEDAEDLLRDATWAVRAEGLYLRYDVDGPMVFNGLSLKIEVASSCALVGRTGCGKSSFLSALVRLYPICGGNLYVHGQNVQILPLPVLRSTVRVLLQDPIFFSGTIRSNLLSRSPAIVASLDEDEALWHYLRQAGLEDRVRQLPDGLDAKVEENGQNFSQGERQLLCLARVLVTPKCDAASDAAPPPRILL
ncbi:unnamed protein product [Durusdinium trenchii]|uniref:Uncharacterized protein n=1 Tax=Durusdinium trenchii TaxID=1381693 RepID=A0ABP0QE80_9DINO